MATGLNFAVAGERCASTFYSGLSEGGQECGMLPSLVARRNIIVIGASAGGIAPFQRLVSRLGPQFPASLFAVIHGPSAARPHLAEMLAAETSLPVRFARNGDPL
jgi:two-component system chemotaxis response regulator CheB